MRRSLGGFVLLLLSLVVALAEQRGPSTSLGTGPSTSLGTGQTPASIAQDESAVRFAVIGDMGTGNARQRAVGETMAKVRERIPFAFVLTVGDNIYGGEGPRDFNRKFELPYKVLLDQRVMFYASLGNHDSPTQRFYKLYNMDGERYYTFRKGRARFFALDSTYMTPDQIAWFDTQLERSDEPWKIAYMHHPLYSSGKRHGAEMDLRLVLEPLLIKHRVQVVFAGHEHFYERYTPQNGVQYFISGAAGQLRVLNVRRTKDTAAAFDTDNSFMVATIRGDDMYFESISRFGRIVDAGVVSQAGGTRAIPVTTLPQ